MTIAEFGTIIDRMLPSALIAAIVLQTAGVGCWAGAAAERISVMGKTAAVAASHPSGGRCIGSGVLVQGVPV